jgi:hypothetical protein
MIRFTCPHCNWPASAAEDKGGDAAPCEKCGRELTIPILVTQSPVEVQAPAASLKLDRRMFSKRVLKAIFALLLILTGSVWFCVKLKRMDNQPQSAEESSAPGETKVIHANQAEPAHVPAAPIQWKPLTDDERSHWQTTRSKVNVELEGVMVNERLPPELQKQFVEGCKYQYFVCTKQDHWAAASFVLKLGESPEIQLGQNLPRETDRDSMTSVYLVDFAEVVKLRATKLAGIPEARCVAVLDLYSKDDPEVICWFHDDGVRVAQSEGAPFSHLVEGLREFVYQLQIKGE